MANIRHPCIREIPKKFKATGTDTNLPGRGHMFILPPDTAIRIREARKFARITVGELQKKVASWGHQVSKTTIRCHLNANKKTTAQKSLL